MEMLYRLSYVGAHDGDHPSGQHGSDANETMMDRIGRALGCEPRVCEKKTHHPKATSVAKVVKGCRADTGI